MSVEKAHVFTALYLREKIEKWEISVFKRRYLGD